MDESTNQACAVCQKIPCQDTKLRQCARCKNRCYCGQDCQKSDWETHKLTCRRPNYLLKFHLDPEDIVDPPIHRTLSCPSTATFEDLHRALQVAFSWANTHTYDFKIKDPAVEAAWAAKQASQSKGDSLLEHILRCDPRNDDGSKNKQNLLRIVEDKPFGNNAVRKVDAMHDNMRFSAKTPQKKGSKIRLFHVLDDPKYQGKPFEYEYDFGDSWLHDITRLGREDATTSFECVNGEGHGCAEDVGSDPGWAALKAAFWAPQPDEEQKEKMRWYKYSASNGDRAGLGNGRDRVWAKETVNTKLATLKVS